MGRLGVYLFAGGHQITSKSGGRPFLAGNGRSHKDNHMKTHITLLTIIFMLLASACAAANEPGEVAATAVPTTAHTPIPTNTAVAEFTAQWQPLP